MSDEILVFLVNGQTEPVDPSVNKSGCMTFSVLIGAPSKEKAEEWGMSNLNDVWLKKRTDQKFKDLTVVPVHDLLLTHEGSELIDWKTFPALAASLYDEHRRIQKIDFHSTGCVYAKKREEQPATSWNIPAIKERMGKYADEVNWDEQKQFFYLLYSKTDAFVVKSFNMSSVSIPFISHTRGTHHRESNFLIRAWTGSRQYSA